MNKIKSLDRYQKCILLLMTIMVILFAVLYHMTIHREGLAYKGAILVPRQENGNTIYSGKIYGKQASFTVTADKTVTFQYGDTVYGPYTAKEDSTAIPQDVDHMDSVVGFELLDGNEIKFRGCVGNLYGSWLLYNEDGSCESAAITYTSSDGLERDLNGNVIDPMEPSVSTLLDLMDGPGLTHKGESFFWFWGVFVCFINVILIIFSDEIFRLQLVFRIRNAEQAEPSGWEMTGRYVTWTLLVILALVIFYTGLRL